MRLEIQTKRGHGLWAKKEHASKVIDLPELFNVFGSSNAHAITAQGQLWSQPDPLISDEDAGDFVIGKRAYSLELHFSAIPTVRLSATPHRGRLITFA